MARKRLPGEDALSALSIRIPVTLREQIEWSARRQRRSLNQEVILWLESAALDFVTPESRPASAEEPQSGH